MSANDLPARTSAKPSRVTALWELFPAAQRAPELAAGRKPWDLDSENPPPALDGGKPKPAFIIN